jgi:hypothetical protein
MLVMNSKNALLRGRKISVKYSSLALIAFGLLLVVQGSPAQQREFGYGHNFGVGVIIGEPTGLSGKLWTSNYTAFDFGLGWSMGGDRLGPYNGYYSGGSRVHIHMDYLWHSFDSIRSAELFPLYYGVGGRLNNGAGYNSSFAVRGVLGIAWLPRGTPIDVFLELAPSLQLTSSTGFGIDAGFGARYFF